MEILWLNNKWAEHLKRKLVKEELKMGNKCEKCSSS
jgi:hypothetical protein